MELGVGTLDRAISELELEIAEHKGRGHPDTLCDAIAERLSRRLCREYLARCGAILHHNVDKALLRGGASRPAFGGGEVVSPIEIYLAGRATSEVNGARVPVDDLAVETAREWLGRLHALDVDRHVRIHSLVRPGSADLVGLFESGRRAGARPANDTSFGAGYAPLSDLERAVLAGAAELRRLAADPASPEVGEDTKVMGVRRGQAIRLTVACAFVGRHLASLREYADARARVADRVGAAAAGAIGRAVDVAVNAADDDAAGRVYLTVTGTSAEAGDDGQVGRGNRVNGLITPYRPMTLEAVAGKNPVTHVGKLYTIAAHELAAALVERIPGVVEANCRILGRIGHPVDDPEVVDVQLARQGGGPAAAVAADVGALVAEQLAGLDGLAARLLRRPDEIWF